MIVNLHRGKNTKNCISYKCNYNKIIFLDGRGRPKKENEQIMKIKMKKERKSQKKEDKYNDHIAIELWETQKFINNLLYSVNTIIYHKVKICQGKCAFNMIKATFIIATDTEDILRRHIKISLLYIRVIAKLNIS
jgi:hypothetical protein